jgi:hypothetical protein
MFSKCFRKQWFPETLSSGDFVFRGKRPKKHKKTQWFPETLSSGDFVFRGKRPKKHKKPKLP